MTDEIKEQLKDYKCHKVVKAAKVFGYSLYTGEVALKEIEGTIAVSGRVMEMIHEHKGKGYLVFYEDDYISFSPEKSFEEGYTIVTDDLDVFKIIKLRSKATGVIYEAFRLTAESRKLTNKWPDWARKALYKSKDSTNVLIAERGKITLVLVFKNEKLNTKAAIVVEEGDWILFAVTTGKLNAATNKAVRTNFTIIE